MTTKHFDFADIDAATIATLAAIPFDRAIVTGKQVSTVRYLLDLDIRPTDELRAVRNTIVREFADASTAVRDVDDDAYDRLRTAMSAVTAVIDEAIYTR